MIKIAVDSFLLINNSSFNDSAENLYGSLSYANYEFRKNKEVSKDSLFNLADTIVVFFANNSLMNYNNYEFEKITDYKNKLLSNAIIKIANICDFDISLYDMKKHSKQIADFVLSFILEYEELDVLFNMVAIKYICEHLSIRHKRKIDTQKIIDEFKNKNYNSVTEMYKDIEFFVINKTLN